MRYQTRSSSTPKAEKSGGASVEESEAKGNEEIVTPSGKLGGQRGRGRTAPTVEDKPTAMPTVPTKKTHVAGLKADLLNCEVCGTKFLQQRALMQHIAFKHPEEAAAKGIEAEKDEVGDTNVSAESGETPAAPAMEQTVFPCKLCVDREFLTGYGLERHLKLVHPELSTEQIEAMLGGEVRSRSQAQTGGGKIDDHGGTGLDAEADEFEDYEDGAPAARSRGGGALGRMRGVGTRGKPKGRASFPPTSDMYEGVIESCDICHRQFSSKRSLSQHLMTVHGIVAPQTGFASTPPVQKRGGAAPRSK